MTDLETELLRQLALTASSIEWALSFCENGVMPMEGVNSLRRDLHALTEIIESRYSNLTKG
jgi:hypothetical protein